MTSPRVSVCIPTCGRVAELRECLDALRRQIDPPDEIVVSDASPPTASSSNVWSAIGDAARWPCPVIQCATTRAALPWQRWWSFTHSTGDLVLFLDDDVRLTREAVGLLREAYREWPDLAGVGFTIAYDGEREHRPTRLQALRARWLGVAGARPGSITAGGITVDHPVANGRTYSMDVDWLSGGAMSFRRDVLQRIGPLERLFMLYDARIGKAEDSVLSHRARALGPLRLIVGTHARHPALDRATRTANPQDGYRKGLLETWGRAHVVCWLARDRSASHRAWLRIASLELARAAHSLVRHPATPSRWQRLAGDIVGIQRTVRAWHDIPAHAGAVPDSSPSSNAARRATA